MLGPAELRQKHQDFGSYTVDDASVRAQQCTIRSMNFGQDWRTEKLQSISYSITLPSTLFVDFVNCGLPELADDMKKHPDENDEYEQLLREYNWPITSDMIMPHSKLAISTLAWFAHEMMLRWFGDGEPTETPGVVFNTIDSVSFDGDNPCIKGTGRVAGISVKYQDV